MLVTEEQLEEYLARGHEVTGVEFKSPGPRSSPLLQAKVVRAAVGMSNHRDGGQGRLVMLLGEPGIGKTRTAQELAAIAGIGLHWLSYLEANSLITIQTNASGGDRGLEVVGRGFPDHRANRHRD